METTELQQNVTEWAERHRHWLATAIRECGHHEMHFSKTRNICVACSAESGYVSLSEALELAYPTAVKTEDDLLADVYMPNGELMGFGFFGGGPASPRQKGFLRSLLNRHKGNPHAEAIRVHLNQCRESEQGVQVCDVSPAIRFLKNL